MNRPFPPYPGPPAREPHYAPAQVLLGLIRQSENRYLTYRDLLRRQDEGFGQLQMDAQNMSIALGGRDPEGLRRLSESLSAALAAAEMNKYLLEQACSAELFLQGELKRWLKGDMPMGLGGGYPGAPYRSFPYGAQPQQQAQAQQQAQPQGNQSSQGSPPPGPQVFGPVPEGWYPPAQQAPQVPQSAQGSQPPQPSSPQGYPYPGYTYAAQGGEPPLVDLRDPKAAEEFMKRAQQMPVGPPAAAQGSQVPTYVQQQPTQQPAPAAAPTPAPASQNGVAERGA